MSRRTTAIILGSLMLLGGVGYWYGYSMGWFNNTGNGGGVLPPQPVMVQVRAYVYFFEFNGWVPSTTRAANVFVNASSTYEDDFCKTVGGGNNPTIPLRPTVTYTFICTVHGNGPYDPFDPDQTKPIISQLNITISMPPTLAASSIIQLGVTEYGVLSYLKVIP